MLHRLENRGECGDFGDFKIRFERLFHRSSIESSKKGDSRDEAVSPASKIPKFEADGITAI